MGSNSRNDGANMRNHAKASRIGWRKFFLTAVGVVALGMPVFLGVLTAPRLLAQAAAGGKIAFEVASIKPNRSGDNRSSIGIRPGKFITTGAATKTIIEFAYNLKDAQLSEGPDWINSEKYDIDAKEEDSVAEQLQKLSPDQ